MKTLTTSTGALMNVFHVLREANIPISGNLYAITRPINSDLEDIVVNTLAVNADQKQSAVINVNVYAPNLNIGGDYTQPNRPRLEEIGNACMAALDGYRGATFYLHLETPGRIEGGGGMWLMNIRVEYYTYRLDLV